MPERKTAGKTEEPKKLAATFTWLNRETWPVLEELARERGFVSVGLFARHLCEEALRGDGPPTRPTPAVGSAELGQELAALTASINAVCEEVRQLGQADPRPRLKRVGQAVRSLDETLKAELVHLREDAGQRLEKAEAEFFTLRVALASAAMALLAETKPGLSSDDIKRWVGERFFPDGQG